MRFWFGTLRLEKCIQKLGNHEGIVKAICLVQPGYHYIMWSGDTNGILNIWKKYHHVKKIRLRGSDPVCSMAVVNNHVWIGTFEKIHIIDTRTYEEKASWKANSGMINSLLFSDTEVWSCGDNSICVWDALEEDKNKKKKSRIGRTQRKSCAIIKSQEARRVSYLEF